MQNDTSLHLINRMDQIEQWLMGLEQEMPEGAGESNGFDAPVSDRAIVDALRKTVDQLRQQHQQWQQEHDQRMREVQEKADALTQGWLKLESEQRRFLCEQGGSSATRSNARATARQIPRAEHREVTPATVNPQSPDHVSPNHVSPNHAAQNPSASITARPGASVGGNSTGNAVDQFQRLQRELGRRPNA